MKVLGTPEPPFYLGLAARCDTCGQPVEFDQREDVRIASPGSADAPATFVWTCPACYCYTVRTAAQMQDESDDLWPTCDPDAAVR